MTETSTIKVHLMRHGEVHNPGGILYGRLPGYHLSTLGHQMAQQVCPVTVCRIRASRWCV